MERLGICSMLTARCDIASPGANMKKAAFELSLLKQACFPTGENERDKVDMTVACNMICLYGSTHRFKSVGSTTFSCFLSRDQTRLFRVLRSPYLTLWVGFLRLNFFFLRFTLPQAERTTLCAPGDCPMFWVSGFCQLIRGPYSEDENVSCVPTTHRVNDTFTTLGP